tara:strand:+ start:67 stop:1125 length:1059 start_codon:yes stop_codon:yes gene_type:complete
MIKNTANQYITFGAIAVADGLPVTTGTPAVYLSKDGGAQATSSNTATHVGNGLWQLELTQSETNADHLGAAMVLANAVNAFTQVYPLTLSDFKSDATATNQTAISNAIAALNDFDPSSQTVQNVTTVGTCVTNSDMRGTDNANTLAPANGDITGIKAKTDSLTFTGNDVNANVQAGASDATAANQVAIQNAIAALNDFDPVNDVVGSVTDVALVAVCTTNSDMRGTNSANTIAPDNAGIVANGSAIAALNDTTPQEFWDALTGGSYASGSFGESILISQTGQRDLLITSHHVAADVHEFQPNAIDGQAIDTSAVTKIQAGLATTADLATVTKTGVQYTATAQSGDTIQVTLS